MKPDDRFPNKDIWKVAAIVATIGAFPAAYWREHTWWIMTLCIGVGTSIIVIRELRSWKKGP